MSLEERKIFFELEDCHNPKSKTVMGILNTNSVPAGEGERIRGIFPTISRVCHSCYPNSTTNWNPHKCGESIYCLKKIAPGEEILISYTEPYLSRAERKYRLRIGFNFDCQCELCSETDAEKVKKSDLRREKMNQLDDDIATVGPFFQSKALLMVKEMLKLLNEENMFYNAGCVGSIAYDGFSISYQTTKEDLKFYATLTLRNFMAFQGYLDMRFKKEVMLYAK